MSDAAEKSENLLTHMIPEITSNAVIALCSREAVAYRFWRSPPSPLRLSLILA
jgi:hypothetical protein